jgi:hypothetical protein
MNGINSRVKLRSVIGLGIVGTSVATLGLLGLHTFAPAELQGEMYVVGSVEGILQFSGTIFALAIGLMVMRLEQTAAHTERERRVTAEREQAEADHARSAVAARQPRRGAHGAAA